MLKKLFYFLLLILLASCMNTIEEGNDGQFDNSCLFTLDGEPTSCIEYYGYSESILDQQKTSLCQDRSLEISSTTYTYKASWTDNLCPRDQADGYCILGDDKTFMYDLHYSANDTKESAQTSCAQDQGTWQDL